MMGVRSLPARIAWGLASAIALTLTLSLNQVPGVPPDISIAVLALAVVSFVRPAAGIGFAAIVLPTCSLLGSYWQPGVQWPEVVALAVLTGWTARGVRRTIPNHEAIGPDGLSRAGLLLAAVAIASCATEFAVQQMRAGFWSNYLASFDTFARTRYFIELRLFGYVHDTMLLVGGLGLMFAARAASRRDARSARMLLQLLVVGVAAAALLNVSRLLEVSLRTEDFVPALIGFLREVRINVPFGDVNAAGSMFALAFCAAAGLVTRGWRGAMWSAAAGLLLLGVWLTGSRTALAVLAAGLLVTLGMAARSPRARRVAAAAAAVLAISAAAAVIWYPRERNVSLARAVDVRRELAFAGFQMMKSQPVFGVGIGEFYPHSGQYMSPALREIYPFENAHNNFIQIGAELGVFGLLPFAAIVWMVLRRGAAARSHPEGRRLAGAFGGVLAFAATFLTSHPLLTPEPAFVFWIAAGILAGAGEYARPSARSRAGAVCFAAALIALLVVTPWHIRKMRGSANLNNVTVGWLPQDGPMYGERVSTIGEASRFYVPGRARRVEWRLRVGPGSNAREWTVEVRVDGSAARTVTVSAREWTSVTVDLIPSWKTFVPVDLTIPGAGAVQPVDAAGFPAGGVLITRPVIHEQQ